jgi:hypothetical protein
VNVLALALFAFALLGVARPVRAEVLQAPFGGQPIALGPNRVACVASASGWTMDKGHTSARPPPNAEAIGQAVEITVAADWPSCASSTEKLTLLATDRFPAIDAASVVLSVDEGHLDLRGRGLNGLGVAFRTNTTSGVDVCRTPRVEAGFKACTFRVGRSLPANPNAVSLSWIPGGGRSGSDVVTFDVDGQRAAPETFNLVPARIIVSKLVPEDSAVDLSTGQGEIELTHPEATMGVECTGATCRVAGGKIIVRGQSNLVSAVDVRVDLAQHVFFKKDETFESQVTVRLSVLHCPMSVASGPPIRNVESARTVVRFEGRCAKEVGALHFFSGSTSLEVLDTEVEASVSWVVLRLGSIDSSKLSITAVRGDLDNIPVAVARTPMRDAPPIRSSIQIPGYSNLNFIPNNREAQVHVAPLADGAALVVVPIAGVYDARVEDRRMWVQGNPYADGLTTLKFAYRMRTLPAPLNEVDLAIFVDPLQRPIHEANIPAPIDITAQSRRPLIELLCLNGKSDLERVIPGSTAHLPYRARDSCRLVIHRERLKREYGTQRLALEIDVLRTDGSSRGESHLAQTLVVKAGPEPRIAWIHGVRAPFDRVVVRLTHVADEGHYVGASELLSGAPALMWTAIMGTARARLYATSTIPTGLYRFGDKNHSGVLSLNFGVISRLTWLNEEGNEGFLGLEGGIMAIGLSGDQSDTGRSLTQIGTVIGIGFGVPIANRSSAAEASINLHGWFERDIGGPTTTDGGRRWSFIFGPSISFGNVGANL